MGKHLKQLELKDIKVTDTLFSSYVKKVSEKML